MNRAKKNTDLQPENSMLCVIGFVLLGNITDQLQGNIDTIGKVLYSAVSMGWINILVQMVIPDATAIGAGFAEIVSTLSLACALQVIHTHYCFDRCDPKP